MPNKKKPRIRNRPRNKGNRLKLLENQNQNDNEIEEAEYAPQNEFNDHEMIKETLAKDANDDNIHQAHDIDNNDEDDDNDDDMPGLIEETVAANHDNKAKSSLKDKQSFEDPIKNFEKIMQSKFLQKKPQQSESKTKTQTKTKEVENNDTASDEKNAFIQNLQKKMEDMMANGNSYFICLILFICCFLLLR